MIDRIGDRKIKEIEVARAFSQKNVQGVYPRSWQGGGDYLYNDKDNVYITGFVKGQPAQGSREGSLEARGGNSKTLVAVR